MRKVVFSFLKSSQVQRKGTLGKKKKKKAPKEQKNVAKGNLTRLEILPIIQIFYLVLLCSANYNAIYLRNIFPSGIYLNLLEYIFPILLSSKRYSQPMRVRTDNTLHKCHKCTSPLFSANEHSSVLSSVKWVLHYRLSTLLVLLFLQLIQRLTHDDCKRCVGVCWTHDYDYHTLDLQMQASRKWRKLVDNWELVKFPGYCEGHHIHRCNLRVTI